MVRLRRTGNLSFSITIHSWLAFQLGFRKISECFRDGVTCVIFRLRLIRGSVVGDALDYYFGVVAPGEGAFGVGPIVLGLAPLTSARVPLGVTQVAGRFW